MPDSSDPMPQISDAEWLVMRVFWELGEATSAEVIRRLEPETQWKPKTIQTLIGRLVQKGALEYEKTGREYLYRPTVDERSCEHAASRSFLDRVFGGQMAPFLANFVERNDLSASELEELKRLLEDAQDDDSDS